MVAPIIEYKPNSYEPYTVPSCTVKVANPLVLTLFFCFVGEKKKCCPIQIAL